MPKQKNPKKTNGVDESVAAGSAIQKADAAPANAAPAFVSQNRDIQAGANQDRTTEMKTPASGSSVNSSLSPSIRKTGKPEIIKTESRSNLVPISLENEIRKLAYLLSERRGFEPGHEAEDWLNAEREVLDRYHQHQQTA
jgi:Protein of unknown function (DUF2934)